MIQRRYTASRMFSTTLLAQSRGRRRALPLDSFEWEVQSALVQLSEALQRDQARPLSLRITVEAEVEETQNALDAVSPA